MTRWVVFYHRRASRHCKRGCAGRCRARLRRAARRRVTGQTRAGDSRSPRHSSTEKQTRSGDGRHCRMDCRARRTADRVTTTDDGKRKGTPEFGVPSVRGETRRGRVRQVSAIAAHVDRIRRDARHHAPHSTPGAYEGGRRAAYVALDDAAGRCARVNISAPTDIDPDVAHAVLTLSEGEEIARTEVRPVAHHGEPRRGLLPSRSRHVDLERRHHVTNESATIEAAIRGLSTAKVLRANLSAGDDDE